MVNKHRNSASLISHFPYCHFLVVSVGGLCVAMGSTLSAFFSCAFSSSQSIRGLDEVPSP